MCLFASLCLALLFSATFKKKVEMLCRDILTDPIRVVVGELGEVRNNRLRKKRHIRCTEKKFLTSYQLLMIITYQIL